MHWHLEEWMDRIRFCWFFCNEIFWRKMYCRFWKDQILALSSCYSKLFTFVPFYTQSAFRLSSVDREKERKCKTKGCVHRLTISHSMTPNVFYYVNLRQIITEKICWMLRCSSINHVQCRHVLNYDNWKKIEILWNMLINLIPDKKKMSCVFWCLNKKKKNIFYEKYWTNFYKLKLQAFWSMSFYF